MATRALLLLAATAACTRGTYPNPVNGAHAPGSSGAAMGAGGVESAGLPYHVLDRAGHQLDEKVFWDQLAAARVVCAGEEHPNPHSHWVQLEIVRHLGKRWPTFALGMEMFQQPFQGVLDDYAAHHIDETALRSRAGWEDRWGFDFALYRPILAAALEVHAALLALNAPKEVTKKVSHHGIESLTADERGRLPAQLDTQDKEHRAWFDALMEDMGGSQAHAHAANPGASSMPAPGASPHDDDKKDDKADNKKDPATPGTPSGAPSADRIYLVQVIWDETMAENSAKWLAAHAGGKEIILAGNGHCHDSAIVRRLQRRGVNEVASVRAVIDDGSGDVASAVAKPMTDYLLVLELPPDVKAKLQQQQDAGE